MMAWRGATAGSAHALSSQASEEGRTMACRPTAPMSFQAWAASPRRWAGTQVISQAVGLETAGGNEAIAAIVAGTAEDDGLADAGACGNGFGLAGHGCARTAHGGVAGQVSLGEGQGFGLTNARDGNPLHKRSLCPSL